MGALVLVILFGLVCVIAGLVALAHKRERGEETDVKKIAGITSGVALLLVVVIFIFGSICIVPNGNVAVMVRFQQVTGHTIDAGLNFKSIIDTPIIMSIQTQKFEVDCEAASKDLQDVTSKIAVNYKMDRTKAGEIYKTIGLNYFEVIGHPAIQEVVKAIAAKYNAEDMISQREVVKNDIANELKERLAERGIISELVNITNFSFSPEFTAAIELKVSAAQNVLTAQNKLEQARVDAQTAQAVAVGKANAAIAESEGKAKAIQIVTDAQVEANKKINETLTDKVLQYVFIDRMGQNVQVWVVPEGQSFNINPTKTEAPASNK
jgi:regulator of protease activity HflC (stomatin/prohibitin superfamily)